MTTETTANPASTSRFLALHALRLKGTCDAATVADVAGLTEPEASAELAAAVAEALVQIREGRRGGYRLTEDGRSIYGELLAEDTSPQSVRAALESAYEGFLPLNGRLKQICNDWQLRDGQPNDHSDHSYDATVIAALGALNSEIRGVLTDAAGGCQRLGTYAGRLDAALVRVQRGDTAAFARPMANSYHDAWMELHQDFLLSLGRERGEEDGH